MNPPRVHPLFHIAIRASVLVLGIALLTTGLVGLRPQRAEAVGDPVIAAAGDIACDPLDSNFNHLNGTATKCHMKYTGQQMASGGYAAVLALGDEQYECGGASAFTQSYDPTWGPVKPITHPAIGNHEYDTSGGTGCGTGAAGYFGYFGAAAGQAGQGYYSFDVGTWHLIALNSNCSFVSCAAGSAQETWLKNDLAANTDTCTLAYFHHPAFSAGPSKVAKLKPFWNDLYSAKADLVLNGHKHNYQRLSKMNPDGAVDANGVREIIVGTGGKDRGLSATLWPGTGASDGKHFGILELALHPTSYDWKFIADTGEILDSGSDQCVGGGGGGGGGGNTAPTAENASPTVLQDSSNNALTLTGHDAETCNLNFSIVSPPAGTLDPLAVQPCTSGSPNTDTANTSYTPPPGFSGTDTFTYKVNDGTTDSNVATVTITVSPTGGGGGGGGGSISLRSSSSAANPTSTSLTIPAPAGVQAGDVMVAGISVRGQPAITPPSGWVLVRQDVNGTTQKQAVYYKVATGSEPGSYTWTFAASRAATGGILDYTGVNTANPIDASGGQVNSTSSRSVTAPSITTTVAGDQLVGFFCITGNNTFTPPAGEAERFDVASNAVSPYISSEGADELDSTAGPTGSRTATAALQGQGIGQLVALRPA
jgi:acid phosphatase type 7